MALPRYHAGKPKAAKVKVPQGSSAKTLKVKVSRPTTTTSSTTTTTSAAANTPITPGSSITAAQAQRIAANAATTKYGPEGQALNQQLASTIQQGADQAGYYQQYLNELAGYRKDVTDRATATNAQTATLQNSVRGLDQAQANQTGAATAADAASRGATVDGSAAKTASDASATRQALLAGLNTFIAARGQSAGDYAAKLASVVGPGQALQAKVGNQHAQSAVQSQIAGLGAQKGSYKQSVIDQLRSDEAKNVLAASIASGKDITALTNTKETIRHHKADEKNAANDPSKLKTQQQIDFFNKHGYYPPTGKPKVKKPAKVTPTSGPGSITVTQENSIVSQVNKVAAIIRNSPKVDDNGNPLTDHQIRQHLIDGTNPLKKPVDPTVINAAFDIARNQGLSAPNVKALQKMGVHARKRFKVLGPVQGLTQQQSTTVKGIFGLK